jgi:hypothetical protein
LIVVFVLFHVFQQLVLCKKQHLPWTDYLLQLMEYLIASMYASVPDLRRSQGGNVDNFLPIHTTRFIDTGVYVKPLVTAGEVTGESQYWTIIHDILVAQSIAHRSELSCLP